MYEYAVIAHESPAETYVVDSFNAKGVAEYYGGKSKAFSQWGEALAYMDSLIAQGYARR